MVPALVCCRMLEDVVRSIWPPAKKPSPRWETLPRTGAKLLILCSISRGLLDHHSGGGAESGGQGRER
jgi:hypothetical protein